MIEITQLTPVEWKILSEVTHEAVFGQSRPWHFDRIDFALIAKDSWTNTPLGYVTMREFDHESVYWQYGGANPEIRKTTSVMATYQSFVRWTQEHYKRVTTLVENTNVPYLKLAMAVGFRVIGVRMFHNSVLCELMLEFKED